MDMVLNLQISSLSKSSWRKGLYMMSFTRRKKFFHAWKLRLLIAQDVSKGMAFLHMQGFIHRDLKSQNVLLTQHYEARVCDFGLSSSERSTNHKNHVHDSWIFSLNILSIIITISFFSNCIFLLTK